MKILVISNLYPPHQIGGYEIGCRNIVKGLRELGHQVTVLTTPSHYKTVRDEGQVLRHLQLRAFQLDGPSTELMRMESTVSNYTNTAAVLQQVGDFQPDCIYLFNLYGLGGLAIIDALNTIEYPWTIHLMDNLPHMLQRGIHDAILSLYDAEAGDLYRHGKIIAMSNHLLQEIDRTCNFHFPLDADIIPGWSDVEGPLIERQYIRNGQVRFVSAGTVHPHKGIDLIIEAASLLKAGSVLNFTINIYGNGNQSHYVDVCKRHQVSDKIFFRPVQSQEQLIEIYKKSDAFLFPTWEREPFGFAPIEAASVGCVPVITDSCGAAERLVRGVHCLKIRRTAASLHDTMKQICTGLVPLREIGENAQAITRQDLSFKYCLSRIERTLETLVYRKQAGKNPDWLLFNLCFLKHNLACRITNHLK